MVKNFKGEEKKKIGDEKKEGSPEVMPLGEKEIKIEPERREAVIEKVKEKRRGVPPPSPPTEEKKVIPPQREAGKEIAEEKDKDLKAIESILEEDLGEIYQEMPDYLKSEFKRKGEETASKIEKIIHSVKVKIKEIIRLIKEWLKIIPGVNKFFIEKEAEIKTRKILNLSKKERKGDLF